jgi:sporulation protein YlmC with PRC-barrel domain
MTPNGRLHLIADVRDLQIVDRDGEYCGIVDDVELEGKAGETLAIAAILVGPGAWRHRLPRAALWPVRWIAGSGIVRIAWSDVKTISSTVRLKRTAKELGLSRSEAKAGRLLPGKGGVDAPV